ncbi:hypothetical protein [Colwellia piezophila]|uniref:hypothetical protein n=1 Tax=Colwellia piezophila TaxID=211668 RepID=UPI00035E88A6|nr:hypothetical protein [Colwellia piezophila]
MFNTQTQNNDLVAENALLTDNRQQSYNADFMWDKLNLSQQYAVCTLGQFGYLLTYVRSVDDTFLAILKQNDKVATINVAGTINIKPAISCRQ